MCERAASFALGAAARMHHHDRLATLQRFAGNVDEFLRTPNILCVERDDLRHRIVEQILDKIGKAEARLVAGRNPARDRDAACVQSTLEMATETAALRNDSDGAGACLPATEA